MQERKRCWGDGDPEMEKYHDEEWGVPVRNDNMLFERLTLEMFQAGLSWRTVLHKRKAFRNAFENFSAEKIAKFSDNDVKRLLKDSSIIRNELKIRSTIHNAQAVLKLKKENGSFKRWLDTIDPKSKNVDKEFKKHFKFMGPEIVRMFLMSVGKFENVHMKGCWKAK